MSCTHYRAMDYLQDRSQLDFKYPHSCYTTTHHPSNIRSPSSEVYNNRNYSGSYFGNYSSWKSFDLNKNGKEMYREGKGDPPFPDSSVQMGRIANAYTYETMRYRESAPAVSVERMQIRLKLLEDSNAAMHLRNRDLIAENKSLENRLQEDAINMGKLQENVLLLQDELNNEKVKLADALAKQTKNDKSLEDKCTSSTNIVPKTDRGLQIWEVCKDCHRELEGCQRQLPTVTITKSEFELLERDMRALRDAVIAREEAWDKAMERERNCRQQLARLTAEAITARHLYETRQDELCVVTETLTEKESELKVVQKETLYLNKLIAKLYRYQKGLEEHANGDTSFSISEKDQRYIEEITWRVRNSKSKSKAKSKYTSDKHVYPNSSSSRESKNEKDKAGSSEDHRN